MERSKSEAKHWLVLLRRGVENFELILGYLRDEVERGGFALADIGASEEELLGFKVNGHKIVAQKWLDRLRKGTDEHPLRVVGYLSRQVKMGGFSLADIGTSKKEINRLALASCMGGEKK